MLSKLFAITGTIVAVTLASCSTQTVNNNQEPLADTTGTGAPVETKAPNSTYKPAFEGQTRIGSVKTKTPYESKVLFSNLDKPWGITVLPDGRLLMTQKTGTMRIATTDGQVGEPITGLFPVNTNGQGGLLGLTIDPDFSSNRMVYWAFTENVSEGTHTSIAKGRLSDDEKKIENPAVIYRATPAKKGGAHFGGRVLFDKSGNLIFSTGDRGDKENRPLVQMLNTSLGKTFRITTEGKPAAGNPFEGQADARAEVYSLGHRNPQGLALHPVTGELWEAEFGPKGGDELNRVVPGKNYGWPTITYGIEYSGEPVDGSITQKEGMEQPVYYWDPVLSPSGMCFYSSDVMPEWKNNLFIGGLSSTHIARIVIENNKVVGEERLLSNEGERFRDITMGKDGALYAVTDGGKLYRIAKK